MTETDRKQKQQDEWIELFELNQDQYERLIENKLIRARELHQALRQREILSEDR